MAKSAPGGGGLPAFKSVPAGAATSVWAATAPDLAARGGAYLADCRVSSEHAPWAVDVAAAPRLWALSETLVGEVFPALWAMPGVSCAGSPLQPAERRFPAAWKTFD